MMREMKDHELEQVFGGRSEAEIGADLADGNTVQFADTKFTEKHMTVPAQAAPFLLPNTQQHFPRPPKKPPGRTAKTTPQRRAVYV